MMSLWRFLGFLYDSLLFLCGRLLGVACAASCHVAGERLYVFGEDCDLFLEQT